MKAKRFICGALLLMAMALTQSVSAQLKTSYFMEGSYFRTELNPALRPTRGYIALPLVSGYSGGIYSNYNSFENFNFERNGSFVSAYDELVSAEEFLSRLPNKCTSSLNANLGVFGLGFYTLNGTYFNLGANLRYDIQSVMPKEFFRAMKSSEGEFEIDNLTADLNAYIESYVGTSFQLTENLTIGARFKFLIGLQNASLRVDKFSVENNENGTKYTLIGDIKTNSIEYDSSNYDGELSPEIGYSDDASAVWSNLQSFGGAIDLGAEMRLFDDHLKVSAAITDLGMIRWSSNTQMSGRFEENFNTDDILSILNTSDFDMPKNFSDYTTPLTTKINMGAEYNFWGNHFAVGVLSHTRLYRHAIATELTTSFNVRPTNWMTFTASHTFLNGNTPGIFGAAVNIHPRAINIFVGMDYIGRDGVERDINPYYTTLQALNMSAKSTSMNIYFGVGFNFGRPDFLVEQQ